MASEKPAIGFVGLGAMGFGMATNLVKQGYPVTGYDVFPASVDRFKAAGGIPAATLRDSAEKKMFYICMVASAPQVQEVLFNPETGIVDVLPHGATFLLCSTVSSVFSESVEREFKARRREDILFIDCPVSGGTFRAADGTLSIMAGGSDAALENGKFLLREMSDPNKLYVLPGGIGAGSNMKMVHQVLAAIHIAGASEAMGLAARLGLDARATLDAIIKSDGWTWMIENRGPRMLEEDWNPGASAMTIILKDVGIITSTARLHNFPTPLASSAEQLYLTSLVHGYGPKDDSSLVRMYTPDSLVSVKCTLSPEETARRLKMVTSLMQYTNIVAAAEAVAFARYLHVDMKQFFDLVINAAGGSKMFNTLGVIMGQGITTGEAPKGTLRIDDVVKDLSAIVQEARDFYTPLHLATEALNQYTFAQTRGWGAEAATSIIRMWEN